MSSEGDRSYHGFGSTIGLVLGRVYLLSGQFGGFCMEDAGQFLLFCRKVTADSLHFLPKEELISRHGCLVVGNL